MTHESNMTEAVDTMWALFVAQEEFKYTWVLPPSRDCLRFAFCEGGEIIDALLRNDPKYYRNNQKELNYQEELCDVLMMLMKYFMATFDTWVEGVHYFANNLDSYTLEKHEWNEHVFFMYFGIVIEALCSPDVDMPLNRANMVLVFAHLFNMLPYGRLQDTINAKIKKYREKLGK